MRAILYCLRQVCDRTSARERGVGNDRLTRVCRTGAAALVHGLIIDPETGALEVVVDGAQNVQADSVGPSASIGFRAAKPLRD